MKKKKEKRDWFDDHVEVIGSTKKNNKKIKEKIKKDFISEYLDIKEFNNKEKENE